MHIRAQSKENVTVVVSAREAQHILEGLERCHDTLEEVGLELEQRMRAAGIAPPPEANHIRYEYAPPLD